MKRISTSPRPGGHGYGKDNKERAAFTALGYAFLKNKIGWTDDQCSALFRSWSRIPWPHGSRRANGSARSAAR